MIRRLTIRRSGWHQFPVPTPVIYRMVVALCLMVTSGCTGSAQAPRAHPSLASPWASPLSPPATFTERGVTVERAAVRWSDLGTQPDTHANGIGAEAGRRYVARTDAKDNQLTVVRLRSDNRQMTTYRQAKPGYVTAHIFFVGDVAAILSEDSDLSDTVKGPGIADRVDLKTGQTIPLAGTSIAPPVADFAYQSAISGRTLYYSSLRDGKQHTCVAAVDVITGQGRLVYCAPPGWIVEFIRPGQDGATWLEVQGEAFDNCRVGRPVDASGTIAYVGPSAACTTFDTASLSDWQVWSAFPMKSEDFIESNLYAQNNGQIQPLGYVKTGSVRQCGGWVYWITNYPTGKPEQLRRWQPGSAVQMLLQNDADTVSITAPACPDGETVSVRLGDGNKDKVLALD